MKLTIQLPNFDGFYHSLIDIADYLEGYIGDDDCCLISDDNIDWQATEAAISKYYLDFWLKKNSEVLNTIGISKAKFKAISSPKEYNFTTDKLIFDITVNKAKFIKAINKIDSLRNDKFVNFIKEKYSDRSGFLSFYSNNPFIWVTEYKEKVFEDMSIFEGFLDFFTEELTSDEKIYYVIDDYFSFINYK